VSLINLKARLVQGMVVLGVKTLKASSKKHILRKLEAEFGEALQIIQDDNRKLLVYSNSLNFYAILSYLHKGESFRIRKERGHHRKGSTRDKR
jgi:hypothetical protein